MMKKFVFIGISVASAAFFTHAADAAKPVKHAKPAKETAAVKQENAGQPPQSLKVEGFKTPESVTTDGRFYYVSNMGELKPTAKDNDGFISLLSRDGKVLAHKFLPKKGFLNSPKGLIAVNGVLYAADVDAVVGFNLASGKMVFKMDLGKEKTSFLNGFAKKDDNTLFVSSTDTGKIFEVTIKPKASYKELIDGIKGPNGMKYDDAAKKLYVVGWGADDKPNGEVGVVDLSGPTPKYKALTTYKGFLDGVAISDNGTKLIFSDWVKFEKVGWLRKCDIATGAISEVKLSEPIGGPADFHYDADSGLLWIPMMMEGKLLVEKPQ